MTTEDDLLAAVRVAAYDVRQSKRRFIEAMRAAVAGGVPAGEISDAISEVTSDAIVITGGKP